MIYRVMEDRSDERSFFDGFCEDVCEWIFA